MPKLHLCNQAASPSAPRPKMRRLWSFDPTYRCLASDVHLKALTLCIQQRGPSLQCTVVQKLPCHAESQTPEQEQQ